MTKLLSEVGVIGPHSNNTDDHSDEQQRSTKAAVSAVKPNKKIVSNHVQRDNENHDEFTARFKATAALMKKAAIKYRERG